jgi:hypothetical protein
MRAITLARAAAQAQKVRLQASLRRQVRRGIHGFVGMVFGLGALSCAHVVAWLALRPVVDAMWASVALLAFDLVVAAMFVVLTVRSKPDPLEIEAERLKEQALHGLKEEMTLPSLVTLLGTFTYKKRRSQTRKSRVPGQDLRALTWPRHLSG